VLDVVAVDPVGALLHRFAVHRTEALGFDQSHRVVEFRGAGRGRRATDRQVKGGRFSVASVLVWGKSAFRGPISPNPGHSTCRVLPRILDREWGNRPTKSLFSTSRNQ